MSTQFEGKTAVITGASRGIGLAIAQRLVAGGANVVITGRKQEPLDEAVEKLGGASRAIGVAGNASDSDHQRDTIARAIGAFGGVDYLVNNAGTNPTFGPMIELDVSVARKILELNCLANLAWTQHAHRAWMSQNGGAIVNVASVSGIHPAPGIGFYGASKAMLISMTELLAVELGPSVRVNAVAPGVVKTKFAEALYSGREEQAAQEYPLKRLGVPGDVGAAVTYLLSEDASWVTGHTLVVDGGFTLAGAEL